MAVSAGGSASQSLTIKRDATLPSVSFGSHASSYTVDQTVTISKLDLQVQFAEGEQIHTENSYKYDLSDIGKLAEQTSFTRAQTWQDQKQQFSSNLLLAV